VVSTIFTFARTQNKNRRRRRRRRRREKKRCAPVATPSLSIVVAAAHPPFASPFSLAAFSFFSPRPGRESFEVFLPKKFYFFKVRLQQQQLRTGYEQTLFLSK